MTTKTATAAGLAREALDLIHAEPQSYRPSEVREALDGLAQAVLAENGETEPCLMCGEPSVPEGQGPLCERCEAGQDAEANGEQA